MDASSAGSSSLVGAIHDFEDLNVLTPEDLALVLKSVEPETVLLASALVRPP